MGQRRPEATFTPATGRRRPRPNLGWNPLGASSREQRRPTTRPRWAWGT